MIGKIKNFIKKILGALYIVGVLFILVPIIFLYLACAFAESIEARYAVRRDDTDEC